MPKRATLTYTSEDPSHLKGHLQLFVYYCRYSGQLALTTDCDLEKLPRRRTDCSHILDTNTHMLKLYTQRQQQPTFVQRTDGEIERQYRENLMQGDLPIGYWSEEDGQFFYIFPDSVTVMEHGSKCPDMYSDPVPPCILPKLEGGCRMRLKQEKTGKTALNRVTAEAVYFQSQNPIQEDAGCSEVLGLVGKALGVGAALLSVDENVRVGDDSVLLLINVMSPEQVYAKLKTKCQVVL
eukprot:TRINITY_DN8557_c0_g1_i1.p3 TRINITY_DN8557_c0_g1~~TRINITY_DN8557_c0_g1_i1.p3  ORF type:complete len:237 (+),score=29.73 TRINITY_DN8557_c0_g1_i1:134-844(+)